LAHAFVRFVGSSLVCTLSLAISSIATAQPRYSWELSGLESSTDSVGSDFDVASFGASYYFDRVEDSDGPYALAAFFDPATRLSITTDQYDAYDSWALSGQYLLDESGWYLGGRYRNDDYNDDVYGLIAGKYLGPRTTLELAVDTLKQSIGTSLTCFTQPCPTGSIRTNTTSLSFVHVRDFHSLTYALSGGFTRQEVPTTEVNATSLPLLSVLGVEPVRTYSIETALYPTKNLGVHVGYDTTAGAFESDGYSIGARWFVRRNLAFELSLSNSDLDVPSPYDQRETRSFRIIGRF
jgi:hypothetical protein